MEMCIRDSVCPLVIHGKETVDIVLAESPVAVLQILLCLGKTVKSCLKTHIFEGLHEIIGDPAV